MINFNDKEDLKKLISEHLSEDEDGLKSLAIIMTSVFVEIGSKLEEKKLQDEVTEALTEIFYVINHTRIPSHCEEKIKEIGRSELLDLEE